MFRFLLSAYCLVVVVRGNQYDPHVQSGSPWFEGWYSRISETTTGDSIAIVTGYFPGQDNKLADAGAYTAVVVDRGMGKSIVVKETNPKASEITVTAAGKKVSKNPDFPTPPNFVYRVGAKDEFYIVQEGEHQHVHASYDQGGFVLDANFSRPQPWGEGGEGPEGWVGHLPILGLHWFVYSLGSRASYRMEINGEIITGTGLAHQEKNWGKTFPKSWLWGEAASGNTKIALAGGPVPLGPITVPDAFLIGYQSDVLEWNFHPNDPALYFPTIDACNGIFRVEAKSARRRLLITFRVEGTTRTNREGFFNVGGPTGTGFLVDSVESYRANVEILAYTGFNGDKLVDAKNLTMGAIEFGGDFRCDEEEE